MYIYIDNENGIHPSLQHTLIIWIDWAITDQNTNYTPVLQVVFVKCRCETDETFIHCRNWQELVYNKSVLNHNYSLCWNQDEISKEKPRKISRVERDLQNKILNFFFKSREGIFEYRTYSGSHQSKKLPKWEFLWKLNQL